MSNEQIEAVWRQVQRNVPPLSPQEKEELALLFQNEVFIKALALVHGKVNGLGQSMLTIKFQGDPHQAAMIASGVQAQARGLTQAINSLIELAFKEKEPKDD